MLRALQLAKNGLGSTYPNPMVGCVIVYNDKIIGEGWHHQAGQAHAEVNAIESVKDKALLKNSTIYVTLEPCSHFGKTPPCADRIIAEGIPRVVVGSTDPNPKVSGNGIKKLQDAGCEVVNGVLENQCREINKRFFTFQTKNRPFIILKWAENSNRLIAPLSKDHQAPVWITNIFSRQIAHKMRAQEQAILIGTNTAHSDNPSLTTRDWHGASPLRIIIDRRGVLSLDLNAFDGHAKTLVFTEVDIDNTETIRYKKVDFNNDLPNQICETLYELNIQSLIIEGGAQTLQHFIAANLWDEAYIFSGATSFSEGIAAPTISGRIITETSLVQDQLTIYKND